MPRSSGVGDTLLNHDGGLLDRGDHGGKDVVNRKHLTASVCVRTARENQRLNRVDQRASSRGTTLGPRFGSERGSTIPLQVSSRRNAPTLLLESRYPREPLARTETPTHPGASHPQDALITMIVDVDARERVLRRDSAESFLPRKGPVARATKPTTSSPAQAVSSLQPTTPPSFDRRRPSRSKVRGLFESFEKSFPPPVRAPRILSSTGSAPRRASRLCGPRGQTTGGGLTLLGLQNA